MKTIKIRLTDVMNFIYTEKKIEGYHLYPGYLRDKNYLITIEWTEAEIADEELDNIRKMTLSENGPLMFDIEVIDGGEVEDSQERTREELLEEKVKALEAKLETLTSQEVAPKRKAGRPKKEKPKEAPKENPE